MSKKIAEIAKNYAKLNHGFIIGDVEYFETSSQQSFMAGFRLATKWIPTDVEIPNLENEYIDKIVLVKSKNSKVIETGKFSSLKNKWLYTSPINKEPGFWRPIDFL